MHFPVKNMIFIMIKQTGLKVSRYDHKHEDIEENNKINSPANAGQYNA